MTGRGPGRPSIVIALAAGAAILIVVAAVAALRVYLEDEDDGVGPAGPTSGFPESLPASRGTKACPEKAPADFGQYWLGEEFEGVKLDSIQRRCRGTTPVLPIRENDVTFIYSACEDCESAFFVTSSPSCEETLKRVREVGLATGPRLSVRGVPAYFDGELRIYSGDAAVVVSHPGGRKADLRLARSLRSAPPGLSLALNDARIGAGLDGLGEALADPSAQSGSDFIGPGEPLLPPIAGAINGRPQC